jgi:hypothetical protein
MRLFIRCRVPVHLRRWPKEVLAFGIALSSLVCGLVEAQQITTFDAPGAGTTTFQGTVPLVISDSGETVGYYVDSNNVLHGFIRSVDGKFTSIDAPGAGTGYLQGTEPSGIGDDGKIVGYYYDANYVYHGFLREVNGKIITIDAPHAGTAPNQGTDVTSINQEGESAGYFQDSNSVYHSFVRSSSGKFTEFREPKAGKAPKQGTVVLYEGGLNSRGETCGFYFEPDGNVIAFIRKANGVINSFDPLKSTLTFCTWINDEGTAVGCALTSDSCYGFIRNPAGALKTFSVPYPNLGTTGTQPNAISSARVITGLFGDSNNIMHGFVRSADGVFSQFDAPGAGSTPGSYQGTTPESINSAGVIVGFLVDSNQVNHGFIRTATASP